MGSALGELQQPFHLPQVADIPKPKGSKYHHSRYLVGIWVPKVFSLLLLGPFGKYSPLNRRKPRSHVQTGLPEPRSIHP